MKTRVSLWDNVKGLLILLVVVGHFLSMYDDSKIYRSLFVFIYTFHMPMFFFAAGLFHRNTNIAKKVYTYLVLYLLLKGVMYLLRCVLGENPTFRLWREDGVPWYMFTMAVFILVTYLLRDVNKVFVLLFSILLACLVGYDKTVTDYLVMSRCIVFYPFYILGTAVEREKLETIAANRYFKWAGVAVLVAYGILCRLKLDDIYELRGYFTGRHPFPDDLGWLVRLECYLITLLVGIVFLLFTSCKKIPLLTYIGQNTLQIYFWHRGILEVLTWLELPDIICRTAVGKIVWVLMAVALTCILSLKIFSFPTAAIMKYRNYETNREKGN
jgi:fucose 4-O-acetylase-like acetyltransferase